MASFRGLEMALIEDLFDMRGGYVLVVEWTVLILMMAIGLGTAATSSYVGQNLRSLGHRYAQQVRAIERWFEEHEEVVALATTDTPLQPGDISKLAAAVVDFEELMLTEAVDWIGITQHDVMELGPT